MSKQSVLLVGLDACDPDLVMKWAAEGHLPVLARLLAEATVARVRGPEGLEAGSVWASFATATSPAHHRRFFRHQAERGQYLHRDFSPDGMRGDYFWETLAAAGRAVCVFDVPHVRLARLAGGVHVVDWSSHEPDYAAPQAADPALLEDLERRFRRPPRDRCDEVVRTAEGYDAFLRGLEDRILNKLAVARHLFGGGCYDLRIVVFGESHCVGHQCFHLIDPQHPRHDAALRAELGDPILRIYKRLDAAVATLLDAAPAGPAVLVLLSHGMRPYYSAEGVVFDELLRRLEGGGGRRSTYGALKRLWHRLPRAMRRADALTRLRARLAPGLQRRALVPDRQGRRFFAIPNNPQWGAVRINLAGRETQGTVAPSEYDATCAKVEAALGAIVCAESGAPFVRRILRGRDIYAGPFADELPDLLVEWNRDAPVRAVTSPAIGRLELPDAELRTGDHANEGLLLTLAEGLRARRIGRTMQIVELGPTIAALLGAPYVGQAALELLPDARTKAAQE